MVHPSTSHIFKEDLFLLPFPSNHPGGSNGLACACWYKRSHGSGSCGFRLRRGPRKVVWMYPESPRFRVGKNRFGSRCSDFFWLKALGFCFFSEFCEWNLKIEEIRVWPSLKLHNSLHLKNWWLEDYSCFWDSTCFQAQVGMGRNIFVGQQTWHSPSFGEKKSIFFIGTI